MRRLLGLIWAFPNTLLGLVLAVGARLSGGRWHVRDGVLAVSGGLLAPLLRSRVFRAYGLTLGHVVLGADPASLDLVWLHELRHVRQYELWGPFFLPAYALSSLFAWARGGHYYRDNRFEIDARAHE